MRQLVSLFVTLLLSMATFLVLPQQASARETVRIKCPSYQIDTHFDDEMGSTKTIRSKTVQDLTQWQTGHSIMSQKVLGVGGGAIGTKLRVRYQIREVAENIYCVMPSTVSAVFYAKPEVHIASNFARGSCEYAEVLAHEQKHIKELRKFFREVRDEYHDYFRETVANLPKAYGVRLQDVKAEQEATTEVLMGQLNYYTQDLMADLNERQRAIDTKEEYDRVIAKCDDWNKKIADKKRSRY